MLHQRSKLIQNISFFLFSKTKPKIGPLINPATKNLTSNSQEMADILQDQYCSVFTPPKLIVSALDSNQTEENTLLEEIIFTEEDIIREIDTINTTSAAGPDGLPAIFFLSLIHI